MIKPEDVRIDINREPWDQNDPNKSRKSIITLKHIPTGITVTKEGMNQPKLKVEALVELEKRVNEMKNKTVGVFLARFQPLHKGHLYMIEKALEENDKVVIVLGSANKAGMVRNPFPLSIRKAWLENSLKNKEDFNRIMLFELADWSTEGDDTQLIEWGHYLYYNIVSRINKKHIRLYYSDDVEIINSWFDEEIRKYIEIVSVDRSGVLDGLSATKIRQAVLDCDKAYLDKMCPPNVAKDINYMFLALAAVQTNPEEDFSME